jgi:predicted ferric reductase
MLTSSPFRQRMFPVWLSVVFTLSLWLGSKWWYNDWFEDPYKYPAKMASLTATLFMCWCIVLSARWKFIETYFGGLDKVYQVHKHLGKWSVFLIFAHPLFLGAHRLPDFGRYLAYLWVEPYCGDLYLLGKNIGVVTLVLFVILAGVSLRRRMAYHIWKRTHEWMGLVLGFATAHILLVDADIAAYPLLKIWMYSVLVLAAVSFLYIRFLYSRLGPRYAYRIDQVEHIGAIMEFTLAPQAIAMNFKPSQFVYLVVRKPGITAEPHPYSIASGFNQDGTIKLGIRQSGDHTRSLALLAPGDPVEVFGPYGRFSDRFLNSARDCVFVGGGIGITPFIGMWHVAIHTEERMARDKINEVLRRVHPEISDDWKSPCVALFYVCDNRDEASFDDDISREVIRSPLGSLEALSRAGHRYELYLSSQQGLITTDYLEAQVGAGFKNRNFFLCGPTVMVEALIKQLRALGVPYRQIVVEDFNLV